MAELFERESVEFLPVEVKLDGRPFSGDISYAIVRDGDRPVTFTPAVILGQKPGVMIQGFAAGTYRIFAKVNSTPEVPVIDCGYFYIN